MNNVLMESVIKATKEIIRSAVGGSVSNAPPAEGTHDEASSGISVEIAMIGSIQGAIVFNSSIDVAARMASRMLGVSVDEGSADMQDAVAEILNMIIGSAKTFYSKEADPFSFSVPTTIMGNSYTLHIKPDGKNSLSVINFQGAEGSFQIEVFEN